jgi:hypothetical protein
MVGVPPGGRRNRAVTSRIAVASIALLAALIGTPPVSAVQVAQAVIVSPDPADFTPNVLNGRVNAIVQVGTTVVVGGSFAQVAEPGGATLTRTNLFAFDATTGVISDAFTPKPNGKVLALATDGVDVFVGGEFGHVSGTAAKRVAKIDLNGQVIRSFKAAVTGSAVDDIAYSQGLLYLGGAFTDVDGQTRQNLAAVDGTSGAVAAGVDPAFAGLHNGGTTHVAKLDISPDGTRLVAVGNFTSVDAQPREQIAILDLSAGSASLSDWSTQRFVPQCASKFDTYIRDVDISPDGSYFVVATTGAWFGGSNAGVLCDTASRWDPAGVGPNQQPTWVDYAGGDTTYSIAATGTAVYVGGHFRWWNNPFAGDTVGPGTVRRRGIAALDPVNGLPFSWNPGRKLGEGVFSLVATADGLWVGNDTDLIGGEYHARLAFFPVAGGETVPLDQPATLPGELYSVPVSPPPATFLRHRSFDGTTAGSPSSLSTPTVDWSHARGAFSTGGKIYFGWDDGKTYERSFNGSTVGTAKPIYLRGLTPAQFPVASVTGMFFENGRLYYTVAGDDRLLYRYFTVESGVVGAVTFVSSGPNDGFDWASVRGMTLVGSTVYAARADGTLTSIGWSSGAPVPGTLATVDSASDQVWASGGMFVRN